MRSAFAQEWIRAPITRAGETLCVGDHIVMCGWERPLMRAFAELLSGPAKDILEIGYGMGVFAECVREVGARTHCIVEAHPELAESARAWGRGQSAEGISVLEGFWQDVVADAGTFDAVFYDSYSPKEELSRDLLAISEIAAKKLLRPKGRFAFWTAEPSLSPDLQCALLKLYSRIELSQVKGLLLDEESLALGLRPEMLVPVCAL